VKRNPRDSSKRVSAVLFFALAAAGALRGAADDLVSQGKRAFDGQRYSEAVQLFERARAVSNSCDVLFYLGLTRYRLKQIDNAIVDLRSAKECDGRSVEVRIALAEAYAAKGDDNRSMKEYSEVLKLDPSNELALRAAVVLYLRHDMNDEAAPLLETLATRHPGDSRIHADLGSAYAATAHTDQAESHFQRALALDPMNASALTGLGGLYLKTGRPGEAIAILTRAAEREPSAYEPRFLLGSAYNTEKRFAQAEVELRKAAERAPDNPEIFYQMAQAYRGLRREPERKQALARFSELRARSTQAVDAQREAARLLQQAGPLVNSGELDGALQLLEKARNLDPRNPRLLFRLAGLYYDTGRYGPARQFVTKALTIAPAEWSYHYLLALIEKNAGTAANARQELETAARLNPSAADVYNQLGDLAMRALDYSSARQYFEKAASLDPSQPAYRANRDAAQRLMGRQ
jgi:tetratricopeptide (TPR) repeat protein